MAAAVRYINLRNGVFRYERWVPEELRGSIGMKSFRRSLRTKDQSEALARAAIVEREYDRLIATAANDEGIHAVAATSAPTPLQLNRAVTQSDLDMLESDRRRMSTWSWQQSYLMADADPEHAAMLADQWEQWQQHAEARRESIITPGFDDPNRHWLPSPTREACEAIAAFGFDAPHGSPAFGAIVASIRRGYIAADHDISELLAGRGALRVRQPSRASTAPTITEAVNGYLDHRQPSEKTKREVQRYVAEFIELVGDKRLDQCTRSDFEQYVKFRANRTVGGGSEGSIMRPASAQTVAKALTFLRAPIDFAINHDDYDFAGPNPAAGIKIDAYVKEVDRAVMPRKRPFKIGELNKIFEHPWFTGCFSATNTQTTGLHRLAGAEYWVPIVALFTGCRLSELAGLRISEVMLDDPHPHIVIKANAARRLKTESANRCVPILDALFEQGFGHYVNTVRASGSDRLFPDWHASPDSTGEHRWTNSRLIRSFNRTLIAAQLGSTLPASARREVTFHSFRGALKSMLGSSEYRLNPNVINEIIGHAKSSLDQRYVGTIGIEEIYDATHACRFKGLVMPPSTS